MKPKDFWTLIVTMIVGGLTYSIVSFSYMHTKFTTTDIFIGQTQRIDRIDSRIEKRLGSIESKLDRLIEGKRK